MGIDNWESVGRGYKIDRTKASSASATLSSIAEKVSESVANVTTAITNLNNLLQNLAQYVEIDKVDPAVVESLIQQMAAAINGVSEKIDEIIALEKAYSESSNWEHFWGTVGMAGAKFGEGILSVGEELTDGLVSIFGGFTGAKWAEDWVKNDWSHDAFGWFYDSKYAKASLFSEDSAIAGAFYMGGKIAGYSMISGGTVENFVSKVPGLGTKGVELMARVGSMGGNFASSSVIEGTIMGGIAGLGIGTESGIKSGENIRGAFFKEGLGTGAQGAVSGFVGGKVGEKLAPKISSGINKIKGKAASIFGDKADEITEAIVNHSDEAGETIANNADEVKLSDGYDKWREATKNKVAETGASKTAEKGATEAVENGASQATKKGTTEAVENGASQATEKGTTEAVENGASQATKKGTTEAVENGASQATKKGTTEAVENGASQATEKGTPEAVETGAGPKGEGVATDSSSYFQKAGDLPDNPNTSTNTGNKSASERASTGTATDSSSYFQKAGDLPDNPNTSTNTGNKSASERASTGTSKTTQKAAQNNNDTHFFGRQRLDPEPEFVENIAASPTNAIQNKNISEVGSNVSDASNTLSQMVGGEGSITPAGSVMQQNADDMSNAMAKYQEAFDKHDALENKLTDLIEQHAPESDIQAVRGQLRAVEDSYAQLGQDIQNTVGGGTSSGNAIVNNVDETLEGAEKALKGAPKKPEVTPETPAAAPKGAGKTTSEDIDSVIASRENLEEQYFKHQQDLNKNRTSGYEEARVRTQKANQELSKAEYAVDKARENLLKSNNQDVISSYNDYDTAFEGHQDAIFEESQARHYLDQKTADSKAIINEVKQPVKEWENALTNPEKYTKEEFEAIEKRGIEAANKYRNAKIAEEEAENAVKAASEKTKIASNNLQQAEEKLYALASDKGDELVGAVETPKTAGKTTGKGTTEAAGKTTGDELEELEMIKKALEAEENRIKAYDAAKTPAEEWEKAVDDYYEALNKKGTPKEELDKLADNVNEKWKAAESVVNDYGKAEKNSDLLGPNPRPDLNSTPFDDYKKGVEEFHNQVKKFDAAKTPAEEWEKAVDDYYEALNKEGTPKEELVKLAENVDEKWKAAEGVLNDYGKAAKSTEDAIRVYNKAKVAKTPADEWEKAVDDYYKALNKEGTSKEELVKLAKNVDEKWKAAEGVINDYGKVVKEVDNVTGKTVGGISTPSTKIDNLKNRSGSKITGGVIADASIEPVHDKIKSSLNINNDIKMKKSPEFSGDNTQPGGTQPGGTQPGGTQPGDTQPGGTQPGDTQPGDTQPGGTQPGGTQPGGTQPGGDQSGYTPSGGGGGPTYTTLPQNTNETQNTTTTTTTTKDPISTVTPGNGDSSSSSNTTNISPDPTATTTTDITTPPSETPITESTNQATSPVYHTGGGYSESTGYTSEVPEDTPLDTTTEETTNTLDDLMGETTTSIDDIIKGNKYTKIPTSTTPIKRNSPKNSSGSAIIPVAAGLSAAAAAGIGAKAYIDRKNNSDNGDEEEYEDDWSEEDWSEDDSENLDYENDTSEAENEEDLTDYETSEIDKYDAKENKELEDLQ